MPVPPTYRFLFPLNYAAAVFVPVPTLSVGYLYVLVNASPIIKLIFVGKDYARNFLVFWPYIIKPRQIFSIPGRISNYWNYWQANPYVQIGSSPQILQSPQKTEKIIREEEFLALF